jgi:hypothetical protein
MAEVERKLCLFLPKQAFFVFWEELERKWQLMQDRAGTDRDCNRMLLHLGKDADHIVISQQRQGAQQPSPTALQLAPNKAPTVSLRTGCSFSFCIGYQLRQILFWN